MADLQDDSEYQRRVREGQKLLEKARGVPSQANSEPQSDESKRAAPIRRFTQPPPPPKILGGGDYWIPRGPKPTQALLDLPPYYPNHLKRKTTVIIGKAVKKFTDQSQTGELCRHIISELTPSFCEAVRRKSLRDDMALSAMSDLLGSLLIHNCDNASEMSRLAQELKKSDEWLKFAEELPALPLDDPADLDSVLGLLNKGRFERDLPAFLSGASAHVPLTMIMVDLDSFKAVNDGQSYSEGDKVLKVAASHVKTSCAEKGSCYRWGGDEFAILLRNYTVVEALALGERIRRGIEDAAKEWHVTASVGIASFPETTEKLEQLFGDAEKAMKAAKKAGKNRVHTAEPAS